MTLPQPSGDNAAPSETPTTPQWAESATEPSLPDPRYPSFYAPSAVPRDPLGPAPWHPMPGHMPHPLLTRMPDPTPSHTGIAVLATVLFPPLGIWALWLSGQINTRVAVGDVIGAAAISHKVRTLSVIGIAVGALIVLLLCMGACSAMSDPYYSY